MVHCRIHSTITVLRSICVIYITNVLELFDSALSHNFNPAGSDIIERPEY